VLIKFFYILILQIRNYKIHFYLTETKK